MRPETNPVEAVRYITAGGAEYSLEATGVPSVFLQAVESLAPLGTCGLVGAAPVGADASTDWLSLMLGRRVKGIIQGESIPEVFIPQLIEWYTQGRFPFDRLISSYSLEEINQAAREAEEGTTIKPVLCMPRE